MSQSRDRSGPRSDTGRAEAFSDGVLAIVITLLVLDLRPPEHEPGQLLPALLDQWPSYLAYVTSFLYVGVVWLNHKAAFQRIRQMDRGLHWANLGILFTTGLLPFPTAVIADAVEVGDAADVRAAVGLDGLVGVLLCVSWWVFFHYLGRHPELTEEDVHERFFPRERIRALVGILLYAAAGVIGDLVAPPFALVAFLFLAVFYGFTSHGLDELPAVARRGSPKGAETVVKRPDRIHERVDRGLLRGRASDEQQVRPFELFFDLVFVLAVTQLSHRLLDHLTLGGAAQTLLLLLVVWQAWVTTTWVTNWFNPDQLPVRLMLVEIMLASLFMSAAIPDAFGDRGLMFAAAVAAIHVGRAAFAFIALRGSLGGHDPLTRTFQRALTWHVAAGVLWIAGGLLDGWGRYLAWASPLS